ncbi:putative glutamate decarboxylase [Microdochium trichocladiopsis]|uniref:Glutamate decarboxylase n=1 Tax=Microdochium trichocladiopsis TaxID=1682393 RepID=A0A9P9BSU6_9PEZI|nr:putative glutamate decarboxylase [Microdochium trichocladiopsis]KAH7029186.1 putative glutamate decarboxylase [Microdochium trichocladiopsis]
MAADDRIQTSLSRADEAQDLINAVSKLLIGFIRTADESAPSRAEGRPTDAGERNTLVQLHKPSELLEKLAFSLPTGNGVGKDGLLETIGSVLEYSVNTWDQGFMDKLYSSTNPVGVVSELVLAVLNTNAHVYNVSPTLTLIEKTTARQLAKLFGFEGPRAGGVTCQGGSSSNLTSLIIARNALYPETKAGGNVASGQLFAIFTSAHGHYSVEKAATIAGFGAAAVFKVPVDAEGRMGPASLREKVLEAKRQGRTPLYVNATAGTTVLGSYDPFVLIAAVCREFGMWLHIDGSWGGSAIFSAKYRRRLEGTKYADSVTVNPHKMMNVPLTCSFLLTNDLAVFKKANTLPAGYLFHGDDDDDEEDGGSEVEQQDTYWDLADLTLQCGRRADSFKLAMAWVYYGAAGFEQQVDHAFEMAQYLADLVKAAPDFRLVSRDPPPCLQVCFYYTPGGVLLGERHADNTTSVATESSDELERASKENSRRTAAMVKKLVSRGFMIDYAPGPYGQFFRAVVNCQTLKSTVDGLLKSLSDIGPDVVGQQANSVPTP